MANTTRWKKGHIPWNKGISGTTSHSYGTKRTEEQRKKISEGIKKHYDKIGRKSTDNELKRRNSKNHHWRQEVFKRDNYTCCHCKSKEKLHAHHLQSFAKHPHLRYKTSNGITLCSKGHGKLHNIDYEKATKKLTCQQCNQKFPINDGHYNQKFCSKTCAYQYRRDKPSAKKGRKYPHLQRAESRNCLACNKAFRATKDTYKRKQKYCSFNCYLKKRWGFTEQKANKVT